MLSDLNWACLEDFDWRSQIEVLGTRRCLPHRCICRQLVEQTLALCANLPSPAVKAWIGESTVGESVLGSVSE
eukprot:2697054-Rhodomonas_salina.1